MTGDGVSGFIYGLVLLVMVGSGLAARRLPIGQAARMAIAWLLIFGVGFAAFALRDDFRALGARMMADVAGERGQASGRTLRVRMADDGHFWIRATVNGHATRFLVDSGATTTALSADAATAANVTPDANGFGVMISTANGTVTARRARVTSLEVGPVRRSDFAVVTAPEFGETSVLGMNFLSTLRSWSVEGGRTLVLQD